MNGDTWGHRNVGNGGQEERGELRTPWKFQTLGPRRAVQPGRRWELSWAWSGLGPIPSQPSPPHIHQETPGHRPPVSGSASKIS